MGQESHSITRPLVVGLGEALFDCFPNQAVLGGAPINVAVHAHSLLALRGGRAITATRVGRDAFGERFLQEIADRGMDTSAVQLDAERPTGTVAVNVARNGSAEYHFADNVAWDNLEFSDRWRRLAEEADAICFGTLSQRSIPSRAAIRSFVLETKAKIRLFDINLRQEFYSQNVIEESLRAANAVKLNDGELQIVARLLALRISANNTLESVARQLLERFELDWLLVTRGERGAMYLDSSSCTHADVYPVAAHPNADTVGAGDASCAAMMVGKLSGWPDETTLGFSMRLASYVASQPGATPLIPAALLSQAPSS